MIKVYTGKLLELPVIEVLFPHFGNKEHPNLFGEKLFADFSDPVVSVAEDPAQADYFFIPHNYNYIKNDTAYVNEFVSLSKKFSKKIIVFMIGDSDAPVLVENSIIFRHSQYRYKKLPNEIIIPGYAVDLGKHFGVHVRHKGPAPVVGFCGWAGFGSFKEKFGYYYRNALLSLKSLLGDQYASTHKKGLYFRKKAMAKLAASGIATNFVIRRSYGAHQKTIEVDPQKSRKEYVENIIASDFVLAPKGDGNFSTRFFETISLGRIPLLIDTECVLPLEGIVKYDQFILRVDYKDLEKLGKTVNDFFERISDDDFVTMQKKAREAFEQYLRIDVFYRYIFNESVLEKIG